MDIESIQNWKRAQSRMEYKPEKFDRNGNLLYNNDHLLKIANYFGTFSAVLFLFVWVIA